MHQIAVFSSSTRDDVAVEDGLALLAGAGVPADKRNAVSLASGMAFEISVENITPQTATELRAVADGQALDVNIVPRDNRRKSLLIADMDSTIVTTETLDDMATLAGLSDLILPITARAMRGELDFEAALDERLALFAGQPASLVDDALNAVKLSGGAEALVRTMRGAGAACYLISGGFTAITGPVAARCGFTGDHANILEMEDGQLLGRVTKPVLDSDAKARFLAQYCAELGISAADAACVGDGANDLPMLQAAGYGVAYHGKPLLREHIALQLNHTDLRGLLFLQGYREDEFTVA